MIPEWQANAPREEGGREWIWFALLVAALALLGGSARPDAVQDAALRPLAALLLIPALASLRARDLAAIRVPLLAGAGLLVWMVAQLVPLPPGLWHALPGRDLVADLDRIAGVEGAWRSITLTPFRSLGSLLAMLVPLVAVLLAVATRVRGQTMLIAIAALGVVNALMGILQVIGGPGSPFYLYALTNRGSPAGIFANENHAGVFAAVVLLVLARLASAAGGTDQDGRLPVRARLALGPIYLLVLVGVLIGGSRAALACTLLAMLAGLMMARADWRARTPAATVTRARNLALLAAGGMAIAAILAAFIASGRAPAAADLLAKGAIEDIRWSLWPVLADMMRDHWLAGTGFGSFDAVYRIYEPTDLLLPLYINHAHNDWAQVVIEGGLPAVLCLLALVGWVIAAIRALLCRGGLRSRSAAVFWAAWLAILIAASLVDYPLRTPTFQAVSIWLLLVLARDRANLTGARRASSGASDPERVKD